MTRYSIEQRQQFVREFRASGLTQRAFAKKHGINVNTLHHWLNRGVTQSEQKCPAFVEVRQAAPTPSKGEIRLCIRGEVELALEELPPVEYLVELSRALG